MTHYRFPRTLHEAFGPDAASACAITRYRAPVWPRVLLWSLATAATLLAFALALGVQP